MLMGMLDKEITCVACGRPFVFSLGEQKFYLSRGLLDEPKRCQACRVKKKFSGASGDRPGEEPGPGQEPGAVP